MKKRGPETFKRRAYDDSTTSDELSESFTAPDTTSTINVGGLQEAEMFHEKCRKKITHLFKEFAPNGNLTKKQFSALLRRLKLPLDRETVNSIFMRYQDDNCLKPEAFFGPLRKFIARLDRIPKDADDTIRKVLMQEGNRNVPIYHRGGEKSFQVTDEQIQQREAHDMHPSRIPFAGNDNHLRPQIPPRAPSRDGDIAGRHASEGFLERMWGLEGAGGKKPWEMEESSHQQSQVNVATQAYRSKLDEITTWLQNSSSEENSESYGGDFPDSMGDFPDSFGSGQSLTFDGLAEDDYGYGGFIEETENSFEGISGYANLNIEHWTYFDVINWLATVRNGVFAGYLHIFKNGKVDGEKILNESDDYFLGLGLPELVVAQLRPEIERARKEFLRPDQQLDELAIREKRNVDHLHAFLGQQNLGELPSSISAMEIKTWTPEMVAHWTRSLEMLMPRDLFADRFLKDFVDGLRLVRITKDEIENLVPEAAELDVLLLVRQIELLKNTPVEHLRRLFNSAAPLPVPMERLTQKSVVFTKQPFGFSVMKVDGENFIVEDVMEGSEAFEKGVRRGWVVFSVNRRVLGPSLTLRRVQALLVQARLPAAVDFLHMDGDTELDWGRNRALDRQVSNHIQRRRSEAVISGAAGPRINLEEEALEQLGKKHQREFNVMYDTQLFGEERRVFNVDSEERTVFVSNPAYVFEVPAKVPFHYFRKSAFTDTTVEIQNGTASYLYHFDSSDELKAFKDILAAEKRHKSNASITGSGLQVNIEYIEAIQRANASKATKSVLMWTLEQGRPLGAEERLKSSKYLPNHKKVKSGKFSTFAFVGEKPETSLLSPFATEARWRPYVPYPRAFAAWLLLGLLANIAAFALYSFDFGLNARRSCLVNVIVCVSSRSIWCRNALIWFFSCFPFASVHRFAESISGLHVSTGITIVVWYVVYLIQEAGAIDSDTAYLAAFVLPCFLASPVATALPGLQRVYHNQFPGIHRYTGLACTLLLAAHVLATELMERHFAHADMWLALLSLILILGPAWYTRKYKAEHIQVRCFSPYMLELCFPGNVHPGAYVWLSTNAREWHLFPVVEQKFQATSKAALAAKLSGGSVASRFQLVSEAIGPSYFVVYVGGKGTWTENVIRRASNCFETLNFPIHAKCFKPFGYEPYIQHYRNVLIIASDVGIGPANALRNVVQNSVRQTVTVLWFAHKPGLYFTPITEELQGIAGVHIEDVSSFKPHTKENIVDFIPGFINAECPDCDGVFTFLPRSCSEEVRSQLKNVHPQISVYVPVFQ